ncbi:hypothetical protein ABZ883_40280 [Streptomyces sp. NPDC046977]|uniref:hypothetical protein n=1 Tax=Streptomyces sp. NPDC046977 TaxID=3154703 RepID=UPI003401FEB5
MRHVSSRAAAAANKIKPRLDALTALRERGALNDVTLAAAELADQGRSPTVVPVRRTYIRHGEIRHVEHERKGLPSEQRPPAARLIAPRGVAGRLHLTLLFAAACQAKPGNQWPNRIPIDPDSAHRFSWMRLIGAHARHAPGGNYVASPRVNKQRQITEGLKKLRDNLLVEFPHAGTRHPFRDFTLLCDSGMSTQAAVIPYRVPKKAEAIFGIPVEFFTNGWVHLLTPSETAAYLMWLDVDQNPGHDEPYVTGAERAGHYGLGREVYETHSQLEAFGLVDVTPAAGRYDDGKYTDYGTDPGMPPCHRVSILPEGLRRDASTVLYDALKGYAATGDWSRPLNMRIPTPAKGGV